MTDTFSERFARITSRLGVLATHKSLKLRFTDMRGFRSNFAGCGFFLESISRSSCFIWNRFLEDSKWGFKDPVFHIHALVVCVKEGLLFSWNLSLGNSEDSDFTFFLYQSLCQTILLLICLWNLRCPSKVLVNLF